jgi:ABC-type sugar transport system permease subunit
MGGLALDQPICGQGVTRILIIAPFFVMPTVSALMWKNMFLNLVNGLSAHDAKAVGLAPFDFPGAAPLFSIILIVASQWLPFATLILLTTLQSLDREQLDASKMDGARAFSRFRHIIVPHMSRAVTVVILIQMIFVLSIFAEILVTTNGGPGYASTNITCLVYSQSLLHHDVGGGSAGGIIAVTLANIVAIFLMRMIGKSLEASGMSRHVSTTRKTFMTALAWTVAIAIFFPILWTFLTSFKTEAEAIASPPSFFMFDWTLENYAEVQSRWNYLRHFMNSVIISLGSTGRGLLIAIPAA